MLILGIDPGKTTGLAVWPATEPSDEFPHGEVISSEVADHVEVFTAILKLLNGRKPDIIACEKFTAAPGATKLTHQPHAPWVIGVIGDTAKKFGSTLVFQSPGPAKRLAPNKLLRRLGWYEDGDHRDDAKRHILLALATRDPDRFAKIIGI